MRDQSKITSLARALTEWADRPANERLAEEQEQVLAAASGDFGPQAPIAAWLLGTWNLGRGFARVLRGEGRGFDQARLGQAQRRCSLLLRNQRRTERRSAADLPFSLPHAALTVLLGLALEDPGAEPLYELVADLPDRCFPERDALALFARELLVLRRGKRSTQPPQLGPYREVLLHWQGDRQVLALRLADLLELHLQQATGVGATFEDPPARLYPLEAIAVRNVRHWLELPTPKIDHPLMFTNLATMQPQGAWPQDPLLRRLELAVVRR